MKDARVRGSVPHVELLAKLVDRGRYEKWVVDAGQGLDNGKARVHEGVEERQGADPRVRSAQPPARAGRLCTDAW